jgi:hypothetical protein
MEHFSRVLFVVSLDTVFDTSEPLVFASVDTVILISRSVEYLVDGGSGNEVLSFEIADTDVLFEVILGE